MIGRITTEGACAVTGTPFERVSQYMKRGQFTLELDRATPRPKTREWCVIDVVRLGVLRELTDLGISIKHASDFIKQNFDHEAWRELGCDASIMGDNPAQWYLIVTRDGKSEPETVLTNSVEVARSTVFSPYEDIKPVSAALIDMTQIARMVRRKLEAIGTV